MSRCFPYPPPGYARKCASNESLIKLQRENLEAKSVKEDRKREKKEKKREQKKAKLSADLEKKLAKGKSAQDNSDGRSNHEVELLDKSSLTEEHGRPCNSSESTENSGGKRKREGGPYIISKNHGSILKIRLPSRKQEDPATISNDGRLLSPFMDPTRSPSVRLDDQKLYKSLQFSEPVTTVVAHEAFQSDKKMPPLSPASLQSPASKSLHVNRQKMEADYIVPLMSDRVYPPSAKRMRTPTFGYVSSDEKKPCMTEALPSLPERIASTTASHMTSTSATYDTKMRKAEAWLPLANKIETAMPSHAKTEALPPLPGKIETPSHAQPTLTSHDRKMQKMAAKYRDLMDTWAPPHLPIVLDEVDDQDWVFARKGIDDNSVTRPKVEGFDPSCGTSAAQPRAVYLPDVGIYALPYTVPF
ncbi:hypothetical protein AKJ16_DCAP17305 [Drosera capensis]